MIRWADGYIGISDSPSDFAKLSERLHELASKNGRDFDSMDSVFYMTVNLNDDERRAEEEADRFIRNYYGLNFWTDKWGPFRPPRQSGGKDPGVRCRGSEDGGRSLRLPGAGASARSFLGTSTPERPRLKELVTRQATAEQEKT